MSGSTHSSAAVATPVAMPAASATNASASALGEAAADLRVALAGRFVIPAAEVAELRRRHGLSEAELLQALIEPAAAQARPPISKFHVG